MSCNGKADPDCCTSLDKDKKPVVETHHKSTSKQSVHISIVSNHLRQNWNGSSTLAPATHTRGQFVDRRQVNLTYTITFSGSPPKVEMYFWTHSRAMRSGRPINVIFSLGAYTHDHTTRGCPDQLVALPCLQGNRILHKIRTISPGSSRKTTYRWGDSWKIHRW